MRSVFGFRLTDHPSKLHVPWQSDSHRHFPCLGCVVSNEMQTRKNTSLKNRTTIATTVLLFLTLTVLPQLASAQSMGTGTIKGIVADPSGAAIHNATVTATEKSRNIPRSAQTDASGGYVFSNMPIGDYQISVESAGFKKLVQESVHLDTDSITTVDVVLQLGATQESVTVTAAPPQLQTENSELGNLITGAQVSELSLNGQELLAIPHVEPGRCLYPNRPPHGRRAGRQSAHVCQRRACE